MTENITTVILAAGEPPAHEVPLGLFLKAPRLIVCDGAWRTALALGRKPDVVIGDGDSIGTGGYDELKRMNIPLLVKDDQDMNDLCKAFDYALETCDDGGIAIVGATGRREDHALGNIFHLVDFSEACESMAERVSVVMVTNAGFFEPVSPPGRAWRGHPVGTPVSVFAPFHGTTVESEGLKWPLNGVPLDALWRGTLNRTISDSFSITVNRPVLVYLPLPDCAG